MRSRVPWLVLVLILVAAVAVLRDQSALPARPGAAAESPPAPTTAPRMAPPSVPQALGDPLDWREVPLPVDAEPGTEPAADLARQVFHTMRGDGVRRIVVAPDVAVGELPAGPIRSRLVDRHLVVQREIAPGVAELSALDLTTGRWRTAPRYLSVRQMAASGKYVVVPVDERCMIVHELETLARLGRYCADRGRFVSPPTAEVDGPQWRESAPGRPCDRWFRLDDAGVPRRVHASEAACRAALLVTVDGWELTAAVPQYEVGAAYPRPLIARKQDRRVTLDDSVLQPQVCGRHVYWLSRPRVMDQRGVLVRWAPGAEWVEVLTIGADDRLRADAGPPRCVNGVLNVLTTASGTTRLWLLPTP